MKKAAICALALAATVLLGLLWPALSAYVQWEENISPPGVQVEKRRLVTVWVAQDTAGCAAWVLSQAAAYQKENAGVNVWVRRVSDAELAQLETDFEHTAPDVLVFSAGTEILPEWLTEMDASMLTRACARAGQYGGRQLCAPVCMAGYVLVKQAAVSDATPAPTSLFGVSPSPVRAAVTPGLQEEALLESVWLDDGFGAVALGLLTAPGETHFLPPDALLTAFLGGEVSAALLTTRQVRALYARGRGCSAVSAAGATDLVVYAGATRRAGEAGRGFVQYLLEEKAQCALDAQGLLPARAGLTLYGASAPALQLCQEALREGWLPSAFTWPWEKEDMARSAQALVKAGSGTQALIVRR